MSTYKGKVVLVLKYHTMKTHGRAAVKLHAFLVALTILPPRKELSVTTG
jgi:hypothetical protein